MVSDESLRAIHAKGINISKREAQITENETKRKQTNQLSFLIEKSKAKQDFYRGRIEIERGHQVNLENLRSRV